MLAGLRPIVLALFALMLSLEARAEGVTFSFEPFRKATAPSTAGLSAGTIIVLRSTNLKANETLILSRCGEPCNTAKTVRLWKKDDFDASARQTLKLSEDGLYYLWISHRTENNEHGPVFGVDEERDGKVTILTYRSGTVLEVSLILDGEPG